jgi:pimeloyl-ACP methyl ester carboxylesterase
VYLVGHSGGGGMALMTAERLPASASLAGVVLLAVAVSPLYDVRPALKHSRRIWSFYSPLDCILPGIGTLAAGTMDGWHLFCAGCSGFFGTSRGCDGLHQRMYHPSMLLSWNLGGHFGGVNRVFIADHVAPLLREAAECKQAGTSVDSSSHAA